MIFLYCEIRRITYHSRPYIVYLFSNSDYLDISNKIFLQWMEKGNYQNRSHTNARIRFNHSDLWGNIFHHIILYKSSLKKTAEIISRVEWAAHVLQRRLGRYQASLMKCFFKNSKRLKIISYFHKKLF